MASIINSLSLNNFFNYYGDYNQNFYEFNRGLNVIVADNGGGKSKLFSAFSWILKDEVIDSDSNGNKMVPVKNFLIAMISDKAKNETKINNEVTCGVLLNFSDDSFEYEVEKSLWGKRLNEGSPTEKDNWACGLNDLKVSRKNRTSYDFQIVNDWDEKKKIINKIIRPEFLQYALLQGEEVDNVLNFNNKKSLKSAVDTLTNIRKIENLISTATYLSERGEKELTDAKKQHTKQITAFDSKVKEREVLQTKLERKRAELEKYQLELFKAKTEREQLINKLVNAQDREKIRADRDFLQREIRSIEDHHSNFLNKLNDNFFDVQKAWLLYNTQHHESSFNKLRDQYVEFLNEQKLRSSQDLSQILFKSQLPKGSPDSYSLRRMIEDEVCYVCGRDAKNDTQEWIHIKKVLEFHSPKPEHTEKQNFKDLLDSLMTSTSSFYNQIPAIEDSFRDERFKDKNFRESKRKIIAEIEDKNNDLTAFGETNSDEDKFTVNKYGGAERRIHKYEGEIRECEAEIVRLNAEVKKNNDDLDSLTQQKPAKEYYTRRDTLNDILVIASNAKRRIFSSIIRQLEEKANFYFDELTKANIVDGGIIKISADNDDTFSIDICDQEGNKIYGLSEGFQRMKKLAVITAIIATSERGKMDYPLIADAPLSSFGKAFIQGFFNKVPEVFYQSIIMVKDLYDLSSDNALNEIGNEVLSKIKLTQGSFHINVINDKLPQLSRETIIKRY